MMTTSRKKEREKVMAEYWSRPSNKAELDVIDKGDHLEVAACSPGVAGWWLGTLRAVYPQDHYSGDGDTLKMHPAMGVTLKLNRQDGTLKIKGKKHLQWFRENFQHVVDTGTKDPEFAAVLELQKVIDRYLKLDDGITVSELMEYLPACGAVRDGPGFIYRLWTGLLDQWLAGDGKVYVISPLMDSKRLADLLLVLCKHRLSRSSVNVFTMHRCDGETKYPKVYKEAKELIHNLRAPNKKRLIADERLKSATQRVDTKFGRFHCKLIACIQGEHTDLMVTSANFHNWHFEMHGDADKPEEVSMDLVMYHRVPTVDFTSHYLQPLGLAPRSSSMPLLNSTHISAFPGGEATL